MKNLLNNIWCVSALGLVAIGYFTFSVVIPLVERFAEGDPFEKYNVSIGEYDGTLAEHHSVSSAYGKKVEREYIAWISDLARDPFAREVKPPPPELAAAKGIAAMSKQNHASIRSNKYQLPRLNGLFHRATKSVAVIDGKLLSVGEVISGFEIREINKSNVVVNRNGQLYALTVKRDR
ncbi:MAG: hypothetical protein V3U65_16105 [Granulosicoccaceae bacterium]